MVEVIQTKPLVSVVVTFYNQAHLVPRALESVIAQTYTNIEIIVVDDGSSDDTEATFAQFKDSRISFFSKENSGVATARNFGLKKAVGQYICFLDGDDIFLPKKIEVLIKKLQRRKFPQCAMASGYYEITSNGRVVSKHSNTFRVTDPKDDAVFDFPDMRPSMVIYHIDILKELGGFPSKMRINEDGALNMRIYRFSQIICIPDVLVLWQGDDSGKSRNVLKNYQSAFKVMEEKVSYLSQWIGQADANEYRRLHIRNNLCGFLSVGNIGAAREWALLLKEYSVPLNTFASKLAMISIRLRLNLYAMARFCLKWMGLLRYSGISKKVSGIV